MPDILKDQIGSDHYRDYKEGIVVGLSEYAGQPRAELCGQPGVIEQIPGQVLDPICWLRE